LPRSLQSSDPRISVVAMNTYCVVSLLLNLLDQKTVTDLNLSPPLPPQSRPTPRLRSLPVIPVNSCRTATIGPEPTCGPTANQLYKVRHSLCSVHFRLRQRHHFQPALPHHFQPRSVWTHHSILLQKTKKKNLSSKLPSLTITAPSSFPTILYPLRSPLTLFLATY
jgi:hypothetical protein